MTTNDRHQEAPDAGEVDPAALTEAEARRFGCRCNREEPHGLACPVPEIERIFATRLAAATSAPAPQREADRYGHPPCCGPGCEGSSCWDCRGTGHPHEPQREADPPTQDDVRERLARLLYDSERDYRLMPSSYEWGWGARPRVHNGYLRQADFILAAGVTFTPTDAGDPSSFWTQAEWAEWSNDLAMLIPEDDYAGNPDGAQESIIHDTLAAWAEDRATGAGLRERVEIELGPCRAHGDADGPLACSRHQDSDWCLPCRVRAALGDPS